MKLAGVTFAGRQKALEAIYKRPGHIAVIDITETEFNGERAVQCSDARTDILIGYIPKNELASHPSFPKKMSVEVRIYKHTYYGIIKTTDAPSQTLYHAVKSICKKRGIMLP